MRCTIRQRPGRTLTGDGPHRSHVESLIEELGITDVCEHHRWLAFPDLVTLLERSDAGIVAQRANPYSHLVNTNKMFEFLMMGVPAVCTRLRATESLIPESDGVVAYFDSDDEVELAKVLLDLAGSPERRGRDGGTRAGTDRSTRSGRATPELSRGGAQRPGAPTPLTRRDPFRHCRPDTARRDRSGRPTTGSCRLSSCSPRPALR
jgi:glycosyltransferase involved in cell wall biosynthesis